MIGTKLKKLRKNKGLSIAQAATIFGVASRTYSSYELEEREPNLTMLEKLADFYGVTTDYLLGREPKSNPFADIEPDENSVDEVFEKFKSLPEHLQAAAMKILIELADAAQLKYDREQEQLAEELSKTRQTAVSGELLEQWEREQQATEKGTG